MLEHASSATARLLECRCFLIWTALEQGVYAVMSTSQIVRRINSDGRLQVRAQRPASSTHVRTTEYMKFPWSISHCITGP